MAGAVGYEPIGGALRDAGEARGAAWSSRWTRLRLLSLLALVAFCSGLAALSTLRWSSRSSSFTRSTASEAFKLVASPGQVQDGGDLEVAWVGRLSNYELHPQDYVTLSCGDVNGDDDYLMRANVGEQNTRSVVFKGKGIDRPSSTIAL